jgi:hypothetical protein
MHDQGCQQNDEAQYFTIYKFQNNDEVLFSRYHFPTYNGVVSKMMLLYRS